MSNMVTTGCWTGGGAPRVRGGGRWRRSSRCCRFAMPAAQRGSAFLHCPRRNLDRVFAIQQERVVNRDNTVQVENRLLQIDKIPWRATLAGCHVIVYEHLDGTLRIGYGPQLVGRYTAAGSPLQKPQPRRSPRPLRRLALTPVALRAPSVSAKPITTTGHFTC